MLLHADDDVEIARWAAARAVFSLAVQAQALSCRDSRRNFDRELAIGLDLCGAMARRTRFLDDASRPTTLTAGVSDGKEALLTANLPRASAMWARDGGGAQRRASPMTRAACFEARYQDRGFRPFGGFVECDLEVVPKIGPALWSAAPAATKEIPEAEHVPETAEDVAEIGKDGRIEPLSTSRARNSRVSEAIVAARFCPSASTGTPPRPP